MQIYYRSLVSGIAVALLGLSTIIAMPAANADTPGPVVPMTPTSCQNNGPHDTHCPEIPAGCETTVTAYAIIIGEDNTQLQNEVSDLTNQLNQAKGTIGVYQEHNRILGTQLRSAQLKVRAKTVLIRQLRAKLARR